MKISTHTHIAAERVSLPFKYKIHWFLRTVNTRNIEQKAEVVLLLFLDGKALNSRQRDKSPFGNYLSTFWTDYTAAGLISAAEPRTFVSGFRSTAKTSFWGGAFTLRGHKSNGRSKRDNLIKSSGFHGSTALPNLTKQTSHSFPSFPGRFGERAEKVREFAEMFNTWTSSPFSSFQSFWALVFKDLDYSLHHPLSAIPAQILKRSYPVIFLEKKHRGVMKTQGSPPLYPVNTTKRGGVDVSVCEASSFMSLLLWPFNQACPFDSGLSGPCPPDPGSMY